MRLWCIFRAFPVLDGLRGAVFRKSDSLDRLRIHADGMLRMVVIWANKSKVAGGNCFTSPDSGLSS